MFSLCILVYFMPFVFFVDTTTNTNNNYKIATKLILQNGTYFQCPYKNRIYLNENDTVRVEITHSRYINYAIASLPSQKELIIDKNGPDHFNKTDKYKVTPKMSGKWIFNTLTGENASRVATDSDTTYYLYNGATYYIKTCQFNVKVSRPEISADHTLMFILIGVGVLAFITVVQTGVICYILQAKKIRRIEQMALSNRPRGSDTVRYSATPTHKHLLNTGRTDHIYETLEIVPTVTAAPLPPPIETLPRPVMKPDTDKTPLLPSCLNETSTHPVTPVLNEDLRPNGKVKIPAFCAPTPASVPPEKVKPMRKQSTINQDAIANELNDILKKRRTGTIGPHKMAAIPEPTKETKPELAPLSLKPPQKPSMSVSPQQATPRPAPTTQKNPPPVATKTPNWDNPPIQQPTLPPPPNQFKPRPIPTPAHPTIQNLQSLLLTSPGFQNQVPVPPVKPENTMPEYAEYEEQDDSEEEWAYETLDPPSKYNYNIYANQCN